MTRTIHAREVGISIDSTVLRGDLNLPEDACAIVLFAHGSGSGRLSPRNRFVARQLNQCRLGTLLLDLLTEKEEQLEAETGHMRFDIGLLADRLSGATDWLKSDAELRGYPVGYFGASTGAAAALVASVRHPSVVQAIVSRGGRLDLAREVLARVTAPTLLIVGGYDNVVIELNSQAARELRCVTRTEIVPRATHLFEEPGALEEVSRLAGAWFRECLCRGS
jgi:pimeloyl-ACP methyl ester carboxylesterase